MIDLRKKFKGVKIKTLASCISYALKPETPCQSMEIGNFKINGKKRKPQLNGLDKDERNFKSNMCPE